MTFVTAYFWLVYVLSCFLSQNLTLSVIRKLCLQKMQGNNSSNKLKKVRLWDKGHGTVSLSLVLSALFSHVSVFWGCPPSWPQDGWKQPLRLQVPLLIHIKKNKSLNMKSLALLRTTLNQTQWAEETTQQVAGTCPFDIARAWDSLLWSWRQGWSH